MQFCTRCGRRTEAPLRDDRGTGLVLCAACPFLPTFCAPFAHVYRASALSGVWVCLLCGTTLGSSPSGEAPAHPEGA